MSARLLPFLLVFTLLAACAHPDTWTPTVDSGNDVHIDTLQADLAACKILAEKAGEDGMTAKSRGTYTTDDGIAINANVFRRAYTKCMKERRHPVIN